MAWTVKVTFACVVFLFAWLGQEHAQLYDTTRVVLKSAANKAGHDALMAIDYAQMRQGYIVFDKAQARAVFEQSLRRNLGLDASLNPNSKSAVKSKVVVTKFELLDDSTHSFPFDYSDSDHRLFKRLRGPAVVAVIEVDSPKVGPFEGEKVKASVIAEYTSHR